MARLKINDTPDEKDKFKPSSVKMEKDENTAKSNEVILMTHQGIYEFGETSR